MRNKIKKKSNKKENNKYEKYMCGLLVAAILCTSMLVIGNSIDNNAVKPSQKIESSQNSNETSDVQTQKPSPTPEVSITPEPTSEVTQTPEPTPVVTPTPEPTQEPEPDPEPTPEPTSNEGVIPPVDTSTKYIAFTFDDGPTNDNSKAIMDAVEAYGGHVTFFVLGDRIPNRKDAVANIHNRGHEIGNHSWSHPKLPSLSADGVKSELSKTQEAIFNITGTYPKHMRPPYGATNDNVKVVINNLGLTSVLWSVDTMDWKNRDAQSVCNNILNNAGDGSVVLLHDLYASSVEGFKMALPKLAEQGYQFVTVSELYA